MAHTVAIFSEDYASLSGFFASHNDFKPVAASDSGFEAVALIENFLPEIVLIDLVLKDLDGLSVLEKCRGFGSKFVIYSEFASEDIIRSAVAAGASIYLVKPLAMDVLAQRLKGVIGQKAQPPERAEPTDGAAQLRISNVFLSAGIPPHIKGYGFLRTGVQLAMDHPEILGNITKELYPRIADNYNTSPSKVERAIRHAIEVAWNRGRIENLNSIFGVNFYSGGDKPTNGEFIALVADRLIQEKRMGKW